MKRFVYTFLLCLLILRIFVSIKLNLHPDEAYHWLWSKNIDLSYFDHPPMVAYFIKVSTLVSEKEFFVRLSTLVIFIVCSYLLFKLAKSAYNSTKIGYLTLLIFNSYPLNSASFIITPDIPLIFFWILSMYLIWLSVTKGKLKYWILSGITIGMSLLSKYNGIFLLFSTICYLLFSKQNRKYLTTFYPYLTVLIALILFLPVIIWNYNNDWISFKFQIYDRLTKDNWDLSNIGIYISTYISAAGIFMGVISLYVLIKSIFTSKENTKFFTIFSLVPFLFFGISSLKSPAEMHWLACIYPAGSVLTGDWFYETKTKLKNIILYFSVSFCILLILTLHLHTLYRIIPLEKFNPKWSLADITNWFYGWEEFAEFLDTQSIDRPVVTTTYQLATELKYYLKSKPQIFNKNRHFSIWCKGDYPDKCYVINYETDVLPPLPDRKIFKKMDLIKTFIAYRDKVKIRTYYIYDCEK